MKPAPTISKRLNISVLLALLLCLAIGSHTLPTTAARAQVAGGATPLQTADWTVMVFMNGDNNLEEDALRDFKEMARVGSSDRLNIVVQFDRHGRYAIQPQNETSPKWTQTLRFRVTKDMKPVPQNALQDVGEVNMGDGAALEDFVSWSVTRFPARRYMLVIWDHGQGWRGVLPETHTTLSLIRSAGSAAVSRSRSPRPPATNPSSRAPADSGMVLGSHFRSPSGSPYRSASQDETNGDELYNREIQDSLIRAVRGALRGRKLDVIGFDACLMAMVETAYAMREVGEVLVGSQDLEPGTGWQYDDWLQKLAVNLANNTDTDGAALGRILVQSYEARYSRETDFIEPDPTTTLSAVRLASMNAVADTITRFAVRLTAKLDDELANIKAARNDCSNYAPNPYGEDPPRDYFYHIDFIRFSDRVAQRAQDAELKTRAEEARDAVRALVVSRYAGRARLGSFGSDGLAIYFPPGATAYREDRFAEGGYEKANSRHPVEFVQNHKWADFLHAYLARVQ